MKQGKENFTCKNCDICWEETDRVTIDITDIAKHILSLLKNTELGRSALQKIINGRKSDLSSLDGSLKTKCMTA